MNGRQLPAADYLALKGASRRLVTGAGLGPRAANVTRVRQQQLSEYGQPEQKLFMPIDVVADLEAEAGPIVTAQLAALCNHLLVPVPQAVGSGTMLGQVTAAALKDTSQVFVELANALGDGKVTGAEADAIAREIDEALARLAALKLQVRAEAEAGA